jgi:hypothetical protein
MKIKGCGLVSQLLQSPHHEKAEGCNSQAPMTRIKLLVTTQL